MADLSSRRFQFFSVLAVLAVGVVLAGFNNRWFEASGIHKTADSSAAGTEFVNKSNTSGSLADVLGIRENELVKVGGVTRAATDLSFERAITKSAESPASPLPSPGHAQFLKGDENIQVAGLVRELTVPGGPDTARSTFFKPEDFDLAAYQKNPGEYLNRIRPGRVFYPAQPAPDVKPLESRTKPFQSVLQGDKVILQVKADPQMPVVFYTPGVGSFENRLTTFATAADENGVATAVFTLGPGTLGLQTILAASPVHAGQLRFRVNVSLAD